jgi:hypothetical protein
MAYPVLSHVVSVKIYCVSFVQEKALTATHRLDYGEAMRLFGGWNILEFIQMAWLSITLGCRNYQAYTHSNIPGFGPPFH